MRISEVEHITCRSGMVKQNKNPKSRCQQQFSSVYTNEFTDMILKQEVSGMKKLTAILVLVFILMLPGMILAEGTVVRPKAPQIDMDRLNNRYVLTDIHYEGDGKATLTLYEDERFPADAMEGLKVGDTVVSGGEEIHIQSLEIDEEEGYIFLNLGTNDERLFYRNEHDEYLESGVNDLSPQLTLGTMQMEIGEYTTVLDMSDNDTGRAVVLSSADMIREMESGNGIGFENKNVYVLFSGNYPWIVIRFYTPWQ